MNASKTGLKAKKTYTFGKYQDATVTTFFGTSKVLVVRYDPVGQYQPAREWADDYSTGHGIAKLHALMMNAKYN